MERKIKEIIKEYGDVLDHLTFNSKNMIDTLSEMAKDYAKIHPQYGPRVVVDLIEDRIMQVSFKKSINSIEKYCNKFPFPS